MSVTSKWNNLQVKPKLCWFHRDSVNVYKHLIKFIRSKSTSLKSNLYYRVHNFFWNAWSAKFQLSLLCTQEKKRKKDEFFCCIEIVVSLLGSLWLFVGLNTSSWMQPKCKKEFQKSLLRNIRKMPLTMPRIIWVHYRKTFYNVE